MLIAVISDSHGNRNSISKIKKKIINAQVLIFLGDGENDLNEITEGFSERRRIKKAGSSICC
mgnify:CR=1 FL=1